MKGFTKPRASLTYRHNQSLNDRGIICTLVRAFPCAFTMTRSMVDCTRHIRIIDSRSNGTSLCLELEISIIDMIYIILTSKYTGQIFYILYEMYNQIFTQYPYHIIWHEDDDSNDIIIHTIVESLQPSTTLFRGKIYCVYTNITVAVLQRIYQYSNNK